MIQVVADQNWSLYPKGEIVTKLNKRGEARLKNTIQHSLLIQRRTNGFESNPKYLETIDLFVSLFGRRPDHF